MSAFPANTLITEMFALITGDTPHLALYINNPGAGNTGVEVTGGTYARQPITFGAVSGAAISNTNLIEFEGMPTVTATHYGIFDSASGGNLKVYGLIEDPIVATAGDTAQFNIGDLDVNFGGS